MIYYSKTKTSNKTHPDDNKINTVDNESGKVIKAKDKQLYNIIYSIIDGQSN